MEDNTELKAYDGSCHCGLFQFRVDIPKLTTVWTCNCSICSRNGYLWIFPVPEKSFVIKSGTEKALHAYEFAMRGTRHLFCPECGSSVLARRREAPPGQSLRINARMLEAIDLSALEVKSFGSTDGASKSNPPAPPPTEEKPNTEKLREYSGNCHCGAVKFRLKIPELKDVYRCSCSHCTREGHLALVVQNFSVDHGEEALKIYKFGKQEVEHKFCSSCGSYVYGRKDAPPQGVRFSVNARMLKDVEVESISKKDFDGATLLGSKYEPPSIPEWEGEVEEGLKIYNGNCHCGAVSYRLKSKPLEEFEIMSCNCSLCSRNGDLFIYPLSSTVQVHGGENLTEYFFVASMHCFCSLCGSSVLIRQVGEGDNETPINVRSLNGVDLSTLKYQYYDGRAAGKPYEVLLSEKIEEIDL